MTAAGIADWFHRAATRDYFPDISRKLRAVFGSSLGVLASAFVVAVLCGLVLHPRVFALAGGIAVVVVFGVCWPWLSLRGLRCSVRPQRDRATEGEAVPVDVAVSNFLGWPVWGLVVRGGFGASAVRIEGARGRTKSVSRWLFTPTRRGEYPAQTPTAGTGFPFGLYEAKKPVVVESCVIVWPLTLPVGPVPRSAGDEVLEGNVARNVVGGSGDVLGVRPYRRGDSPRRIHWAQSAKHDRLIVCELQSNTRPVVTLVLDAAPAVHTDESREWAIRIAASLAKGWLEDGARVGLASGEVFLPPASGAGQKTRILDALARTPDVPVKSLGEVLARTGGLRVVVTTDARPITDRAAKWAVLRSAGFGGEPLPLDGRPWMTFDDETAIPHQLRYGWTEAIHGS